jgi:hypothetical protein
MKTTPEFFGKLFFGFLLGVTALAAAHHGNPQPPSPAWYDLPPGVPQQPATAAETAS